MPQKIKFDVVHASGQDDNYRASELNTHSPLTRGWASSRFCLYPQDIVIQLSKRCRLRKVQILSHQHLIASKVELYVGDLPADTPVNLQNARYTRLGYVALSDNSQTDYKARELKSVHVDAVGIFLKLVIHKNHVNKHNLYNQVGLIAINVIGDNLDDPQQENEAPSIPTKKPDYISPLDDLAFDMYQDQEVAQIIRKLERKKQDSVLDERYDYAKKVKTAIQELQKVGEKLGKYEVEKRQAVEGEDYDKAKLKKVQMEEYRLQSYKQLNIHDLLRDAEKPSNLSPRQAVPPQRLAELESPRPALPRDGIISRNQTSPLPAVPHSSRDAPELAAAPYPPSLEAKVDRALPSPKQSYADLEDEINGAQTDRTDLSDSDSNMTEKDLRESAFVVDVYGLPLVQKAFARSWASKEECMTELVEKMSAFSGDSHEAKSYMRAATYLIQKLLRDPVHAVFKATLSSLKYMLTQFVPQHKIPKSEVHHVVDKTLPELQHKSGDTNTRTRNEAKAYILEMSQYPDLKLVNKATHYVPLHCVKLYKLSLAPRLAQSHVEIIDEMYSQYNLSGGLTVDNVMKFCVHSLNHTSGQVRTVAENLIIKLYKEHGPQVREYLPPDDDKTRKSTLYRQLFEAFDKIDGKPSRRDVERQRKEDETAKKAEVDALQQQIAQMKAMQANVANNKKQPATKPTKKKPTQPEDDTISTITKFDRTCIFCNEQNDEFTEEGLDLHYWKSCPMLKRCQNCKQVVEIAGLTEHLLTECEAKGTYSKCPRCTEAIPKPEFDEHVKAKACNAADPKKSHCPICHQNIPIGDAAWTEHLMTQSPTACKQNPRRVAAAQNKNKATDKNKKNAANPVAASKLKKPTTKK